MNVLIACEESQTVCKAFRERGHRAFSCDIQECSGGHPEWHIIGDCLRVMGGDCFFQTQDMKQHSIDGLWDIIIAHPPCTYLTVSGNSWFNISKYGDKAKQRYKDRYSAIVFFMQCISAKANIGTAIENPIGIMSTAYRPADQIIQPYEFGHHVRKSTGLWLDGLPKLKPTDIVDFEAIHSAGKSGGYSGNAWCAIDENGKKIAWNDPRTAKARSRTYSGIAKAMAEQWGVIEDEYR